MRQCIFNRVVACMKIFDHREQLEWLCLTYASACVQTDYPPVHGGCSSCGMWVQLRDPQPQMGPVAPILPDGYPPAVLKTRPLRPNPYTGSTPSTRGRSRPMSAPWSSSQPPVCAGGGGGHRRPFAHSVPHSGDIEPGGCVEGVPLSLGAAPPVVGPSPTLYMFDTVPWCGCHTSAPQEPGSSPCVGQLESREACVHPGNGTLECEVPSLDWANAVSPSSRSRRTSSAVDGGLHLLS